MMHPRSLKHFRSWTNFTSAISNSKSIHLSLWRCVCVSAQGFGEGCLGWSAHEVWIRKRQFGKSDSVIALCWAVPLSVLNLSETRKDSSFHGRPKFNSLQTRCHCHFHLCHKSWVLIGFKLGQKHIGELIKMNAVALIHCDWFPNVSSGCCLLMTLNQLIIHVSIFMFFLVSSPYSNVLNGSAVCVYRMQDIIRAFKGNFLHREGQQYKWTEYTGRVPYPRPGTVSLLIR